MSERDAGRGTRDAEVELSEDDVAIDLGMLAEEAVAYQAVRNFEDLLAWQRARELTAAIHVLARGDELRRDAGLRSQLQRAAVSIMSNIAEGHERGTAQEYHRFLSIAKASCAEVRSLLYVVHDAGYIDEETFQRQHESARRVGQLVGALRASIARRIANQKR